MKKPTIALSLALILAALPAAAQDATEQAKALFNAGAQAYEAGKYPAAVQAFSEAYRLSQRPGILFSMAQAYRRQYTADKKPANLRASVKFYRDYIAKVEQGGRRADAVAALGELEPMLDRMGSAAEAPPPAPPKPAAQLMVSTQIKEATVSLDGQKAVEAPLIVDTTPGAHKVVIQAAGYFTEERELKVGNGVVALDIAMREKPGLITVSTRDGADVSIDGRLTASTPLARPIEVPPGRHLVTVVKRGCKPFSEEIDIGRGESKKVEARIDATSQRIASYVLMGVGAAGVVAGGVLAGAATHAQHQAADIDERRTTAGGISVSDLNQYNAYVARRDDFRRASGIALGAGVAVGGTAVLMALIDLPSISSIRRELNLPQKPSTPAPPKDRPMEMGMAPILAPGLYGASFSARF